MLASERIKAGLEESFDIPFTVQLSYESGEPVFMLAPDDPGKELFLIKVSIRNQIRLTMDFVPQKYSVNFIHSMGHHFCEDRVTFLHYYDLFRKKNAKVVIKVNGQDLDTSSSFSNLPDKWLLFEARVTKIPIVEEDIIPDLVSITEEWGSLMMGMILSLANIVPVEENQRGYLEGNSSRVEVNRYERNPLNRKYCLASKGYRCSICGFDFESVYGEIGHHFIHVHHIVPVSQIGPDYQINPETDLIPVCPNCHAMLHRRNPPLNPSYLKEHLVSRGSVSQ